MAIKNEPQRSIGKDSTDFYKSIFDNMLEGLAYCQMIFDEQSNPVDWIYIQVNKNFEKLTGLKNAEGKKVTELVSGIKTSNPELFEIYGRCSLTGKPEKFETYVPPLSRWFLVSVYRPQKGFFVAIFQNITDQKQKDKDLNDAKAAAVNVLEDLQTEKEALALANAKDEALLASIADGIIATDRDGKIILINQAAKKMIGLEFEEVREKHLFDTVSIVDDEGSPIPHEKRPLSFALAGTTTTGLTHYFLRKDGTKFPVAITASSIILGKEIIGAVVVFRDITKEVEISNAKNEFISIASHQLRTPVSGLSWITEALQFTSQNLTPKQQTYVKDLSMLSKRLIGLVEDLLNISRIQLKSTLVTEKNPINIPAFIEEFIKEIEPYASSKKHAVIFNKSTAESFTVEINKKSLYNILQNLISNAIEYSPENTAVTVNLEKTESFIKVSIANKGPVIPKDEQSHIFGRFYRGESAKKMKAEGTGLGLYIVKTIIEDMGGKVGFESEEGKDTTFWFTIPLKITNEDSASRADSLVVK